LEVANELIKILGLQEQIKITEVDSSYYANEYFAERPPCERLINKKLDLRNINIMQGWKTSLSEYLRDYYKGYLD